MLRCIGGSTIRVTFGAAGLQRACRRTRQLHHRQRWLSSPGPMSSMFTGAAPPASSLPAAATAAAEAGSSEASTVVEDVVLQYIVLRRDLWGEMGWPLGSVVAQGCHAATAALWQSREDPITQSYCAPENIDHMHKVVLEVKGEAQLRNLSDKLKGEGIPHKLWIEQPEDYATCLATAPLPKSRVQQHVKKLKLCKGT